MTTGFNVIAGPGNVTSTSLGSISNGLGAYQTTTRFVKGGGTTAILYQTVSFDIFC
jgi:hypothetical protein